MPQKIDLGFIKKPKIDLGFLNKQVAPPSPGQTFTTVPADKLPAPYQAPAKPAPSTMEKAGELLQTGISSTMEGLGIDPENPLSSVLNGIWNLGKSAAATAVSTAVPSMEDYPWVKEGVDAWRKPAVQQFDKAKEEFRRGWKPERTGPNGTETPGDRAEAAGHMGMAVVHGVAGAVPFVGPAAVGAGEEMGNAKSLKEFVRGGGHAVGLIGGLASGTEAAEARTGPIIGAAADAAKAKALETAAALPKITDTTSSIASKIKNYALGAPPTAVEGAMRSIKPKSNNTQFKANLPDVLSHLKDALPDLGRPLSEDPNQLFQDALDLTKKAKEKLWAQRSEHLDPSLSDQVDATPVANSIVSSIPTKTWIKSPETAAAMAEEAAIYRQPHKLADLEDMLHTTNAELDAYYEKYPGARRVAAAKNPETAALFAEGEALRKLIYNHIDDVQGQSGPAAEASRRYGKLLNFEEELHRRKNVFERQQPNSLQQQMGKLAVAKELGVAGAKIGAGLLTGNPEAIGIATYSAGKNLAGAWAIKKMSDFLKERGSAANMLRSAITDEGIQAPRPLSAPYTPYTRPLLRLNPASEAGGVQPSSGQTFNLPPDLEGAFVDSERAAGRTSLATMGKPPQGITVNARTIPRVNELESSGQTFNMPPDVNPERALPPATTIFAPEGEGLKLKDLNATHAASEVVRDPKTGRMKKIYTSESGAPTGKFNLREYLKGKGLTERGSFSLKPKKTAAIDEIAAANDSAKIIEPASASKIQGDVKDSEGYGPRSLFIGDDGRLLDLGHNISHPDALRSIDPTFKFSETDQSSVRKHGLVRVDVMKGSGNEFIPEVSVDIQSKPTPEALSTIRALLKKNPTAHVSFEIVPEAGGKPITSAERFKDWRRESSARDFEEALKKAYPGSQGAGETQNAFKQFVKETGSTSLKKFDRWMAEHNPFIGGYSNKGALRLGIGKDEGDVSLGSFGSGRFFSRIAEAVKEKAPVKAAADQFLNIVEKAGIKESAGLRDWLKGLGKEKVSRSEVMGKIREETPQLDEHWIGGEKGVKSPGTFDTRDFGVHRPDSRPPGGMSFNQYVIEQGEVPDTLPQDALADMEAGYEQYLNEHLELYEQDQAGNIDHNEVEAPLEFPDWLDQVHNLDEDELHDLPEGQRVLIEEEFDDYERHTMEQHERGNSRGETPKFSHYTLPGGTNYREYVATLPTKMDDFFKWMKDSRGISKADYDTYGDKTKVSLMQSYSDAKPDQAGSYNVPGGHAYGSPDLDVNRLLHARVKDRQLADGSKSLFLEELQSDWHQTGRSKGYKDQILSQAEKDEMMKLYRKETESAGEGWTEADAQRYRELESRYQRQHATGLVPDAPFKKDWHELGMKRMLQEAADNGYDSLSWTTGKQQAERYSLSKQVSEIRWNPETETLDALDTNGHPAIKNKPVKKADLEDVIGKEATKKLLESPKVHPRTNMYVKADEPGVHVLQGQDLDIGGEGMKGFYDNIIPRFMDKYLKKYGVKAEKAKLADAQAAPEIYRIHGDPSEWKIKYNGKTTDLVDPKGKVIENYRNNELAKEALEIFRKQMDPKLEVWSVKITPAMREDLKTSGQPIH